jgi:hypothetical protein
MRAILRALLVALSRCFRSRRDLVLETSHFISSLLSWRRRIRARASSPTPEEGRALAITMARHMIHNIQPDLDILKAGRPNYATNPESLIKASQVVAIEFQTIAAVNDYWRK